MAQKPRPLAPTESPLHFFGSELRFWRERGGLSQDRLGSIIYVSGDTLSKVEKAQRYPTQDLAAQCDAALDTGGSLSRLWALVDSHRATPPAQSEHTKTDVTSSAAAEHPGAEQENTSTTGKGLDDVVRTVLAAQLTTVRALLAEGITDASRQHLNQLADSLDHTAAQLGLTSAATHDDSPTATPEHAATEIEHVAHADTATHDWYAAELDTPDDLVAAHDDGDADGWEL